MKGHTTITALKFFYNRTINIGSPAPCIISIVTLKDDIKNTVVRSPDGYMQDLRNNNDLQSKFVTAINQIFDPVITD